MLVIKFGGTSVSSKTNVGHIRSILSEKSENYIVVVSAFSGITNQLELIGSRAMTQDVNAEIETFRERHFAMIKELLDVSDQTEAIIQVQEKSNELEAICQGIQVLKEFSPRSRASILSIGEQLSSFIIHKYLTHHGIELSLIDSRELIVAGGDFLNGEVDFQQTNNNISTVVAEGNYITGGFIARNSNGETVTLGRGGSDYSAAIYASALNASALELWSDINGIHRANPNQVKDTKAIDNISYEEAFELAYFGAKVLYPPSVIPVMKCDIPVYLKNTTKPGQKGTVISSEQLDQKDKIKGISSLSDVAILTISGVGLVGRKGRARQVFQALEESNVNVMLITQSSSEQSIGIGIMQSDIAIAESSLNKSFERDIERGLINPVKIAKDKCIIALVGDNMKNTVGLSGKVFGVIGENGINVTAIAQGASERNISIVIDQKEETKALNVIHERFFSNTVQNIHLFIAGVGNVGSEFLRIIQEQHQTLLDDYQVNLKIVGLSNSSKYLLDTEHGLSFDDIARLKSTGQEYDEFTDYLKAVDALNLRSSIFIDNTASSIVSDEYSFLLAQSISVVTCNKIACSSDYESYSNLIQIAKNGNCEFKYETSVGAALPVIKTIHDLLISGDRIKKIEAVISGSLNFIFNEYDGSKPFAEVVKQAMNEGYTEPNPMIDLSGLDVMRKILILSREAGYEREMSDITFDSFLPEQCETAEGNEELFRALANNEGHFKSLFTNARANDTQLKVVASMENGSLNVALQEVPSHSPFYNLRGKDNVIAINTNRYDPEPLVIRGAGAGANVTASGVFADLLSIINR